MSPIISNQRFSHGSNKITGAGTYEAFLDCDAPGRHPGVGQFDSAKVRLIKFFHEQRGFDVIAFESSIYECFAANTNATNAVDMLQRSIFTVWASEEVLPLFDYIQATQRTVHPLLLAGFDTQISSARGVDRPAFLRRVVAAIDSDYADEVASFDTTFVTRTRSDPSKWDESEAFYDKLDGFFREHRDELLDAFPADPTPLIAERAAYSMVRCIRQLRTQAARPTDVGPEGAEQGNGWMFQPMYTREWGTAPLMLVPREQYDGVLLIDRATPPHYLRF